MNARKNYRRWVEEEEMPSDLKSELLSMDDKAIEDAFFKDIEFGTAGMRGLLGSGNGSGQCLYHSQSHDCIWPISC